MKAEIEKKEKNQVVIKVEIPAEHAQQEYNKACRRIGQRVNVPGFRRGKAPLKMIEKTVGVDRIKQDALERILPHVFADVISEHQLDVVAPPRVQQVRFDLGQSLEVQAQVELRPEVTLPDLALQVEAPSFQLEEDALEQELKRMQERFAALTSVEGRAAISTDVVTIDFDGTVNGEPISGGSAKAYRLDLDDNNFIDGFAEQIVGHQKGESFTIQVTFPQEYFEASLAGKPAEFAIVLHDISEQQIPEWTDELAQRAGDYSSLADLKEKVQKRLTEQAEADQERMKQEALVDTLLLQLNVDISDGMLQRETGLLVQELQQRFQQVGLSWEDFINMRGQEEMVSELRAEAERRIKTSLAFGAIAKQEGLSVAEEEFSQQVKELAELRGVDERAALRQLANQPAAVQALADQLLAKKVIAFLMEKASFTLVDRPDEEPGHVHGPHCNHAHHHHDNDEVTAPSVASSVDDPSEPESVVPTAEEEPEQAAPA